MSLSLVFKVLGFCNVVARFIFLSPSQGNDVRAAAAFGVYENDDLALKATKCDHPLLAVALANVLAGYSEPVPDGFAAHEVQAVGSNIGEALPFVPRHHLYIVVTI